MYDCRWWREQQVRELSRSCPGRIYGRSLKVSAIEFFLRAKLLHCHGAPQVHRDSFVRGCAGVDVP